MIDNTQIFDPVEEVVTENGVERVEMAIKPDDEMLIQSQRCARRKLPV
jgi:hypothetical protein